ncbi:unnamed protein product [Cyprideis torosa]|uniref:Uncharacterized protein n=1 Tax=Cyprideis torosa TaxID=163714 RepID=A0A7R8WEJ1_9CRUS|nr:unnamed protein product [Cyprideis torosa]CAG0890784.1 unnamed protein product [Cyprideis torosa]
MYWLLEDDVESCHCHEDRGRGSRAVDDDTKPILIVMVILLAMSVGLFSLIMVLVSLALFIWFWFFTMAMNRPKSLERVLQAEEQNKEWFSGGLQVESRYQIPNSLITTSPLEVFTAHEFNRIAHNVHQTDLAHEQLRHGVDELFWGVGPDVGVYAGIAVVPTAYPEGDDAS